MNTTLLEMLTLVMLKSTATWTVRELVIEERKEGKKDREGGRQGGKRNGRYGMEKRGVKSGKND